MATFNTSEQRIINPHGSISPSKLHLTPQLITTLGPPIMGTNNSMIRTHVAQNILLGQTQFMQRTPTIITAADVDIKKQVIPGGTTSTITIDTKKINFSPIGNNSRGRMNFISTQKPDRSFSGNRRGESGERSFEQIEELKLKVKSLEVEIERYRQIMNEKDKEVEFWRNKSKSYEMSFRAENKLNMREEMLIEESSRKIAELEIRVKEKDIEFERQMTFIHEEKNDLENQIFSYVMKVNEMEYTLNLLRKENKDLQSLQDELNKDQSMNQMKSIKLNELQDQVDFLSRENENLNKLLQNNNDSRENNYKSNRELEELYNSKLKEFKTTYEMMMKSQLDIEIQKKNRERDDTLARYENEINKMRLILNDYQKRLELADQEKSVIFAKAEEHLRESEFYKSQRTGMDQLEYEKKALETKQETQERRIFDLEKHVEVLLRENSELNRAVQERIRDLEVMRKNLENSEKGHDVHITELKKQWELVSSSNISLERRNLSIQIDTLTLKVGDLEKRLKQVEAEKASILINYQAKSKEADELSERVRSFQLNFVEKSSADQEIRDYKNRYMDLENKLDIIVQENEKISDINNELRNELENWRIKFSNLERNHENHISELKKHWDAARRAQIDLEVQNETSHMRAEFRRQELQAERDRKIIQEQKLEMQRMELDLQALNLLRARIEEQERVIITLEAEKERVDFFKGRIEELEYKHREELDHVARMARVHLESEKVSILEERCLLLYAENERLHRVIDEQYGEIEHWQNKFSTFEKFHEMKMDDVRAQFDTEFQSKLTHERGFHVDMEQRILTLQNERQAILNELESWRRKCNELERKSEEVLSYEMSMKEANSERERVQMTLMERSREIDILRMRLIEYEKDRVYVNELESKIKYLMAENERLHKVLISRCKDIMTGW